MEEAQFHAVAAEGLDQADLGLVKLPSRRDEAAVLVAVRIAEHDFLHVAAALDEAAVDGQRKCLLHH
jgi:hypothetical protein